MIQSETPTYTARNPLLNGPLAEKTADPPMFKTGPDTRLLLVSGGPCERLETERQTHACATELLVGTTFSNNFKFVALDTTQELERFVNMDSSYPGVRLSRVPSVWHDGRPKSQGSYDVFKQTALFAHQAVMRDMPEAPDLAEAVWERALNRTKYDALEQAIVFCSVNTMYRFLQTLELITPDARILIASGAIAIVNVPIFGQPSFGIGAGKQGVRSLQWGTVTRSEYLVGKAHAAHTKDAEMNRVDKAACPMPNPRFCSDMYPCREKVEEGETSTPAATDGV